MIYKQALEIAEKTKALLAPYCERIEIAGSIRRCKPDVGDIEIIAIPKPYGVRLFESGIATVVKQWVKNGYKSEGGYLYSNGERVTVPEEEDLFKLVGIHFLPPELRSY